MTPLFVCGSECGVITGQSGSGRHWNAPVNGGSISSQTTTVEPGGGTRAYEFNVTVAAATYLVLTIANNVIAGRVYIYVATSGTPSATTNILMGINANGNPQVKMTTARQITIQMGAGSTVNVGSPIAEGGWHYIDFLFDTSGATASVKAKLDGGTEAQSTNAQTAANMTAFRMGSTGAVTAHFFFDHLILTTVAADYPIGTGLVKGYVPGTTSGTHSTPADFDLSSGSHPANGDSSGDLVKEVPADSLTYCQQSIALSTAYVEYIYATSAETAVPRAVEQVVGLLASATQACNQKAQLYDGTTATDAYALVTVGSTSPIFLTKQWASAPSGAWTAALFQACRIRWGFSTDASPQPRLTMTILEAEFAAGAGSQSVTAQFISPATTVFGPAVSPGPVSVAAQFIGPAGAVPNPAITQAVAAQFIAPATAVFNPANVFESAFTAPFIAPAGAVYQPSVLQIIAAAFLGPAGAVYQPLVAQSISPQFIGPAGAVYQPAVSPGPVSVAAQFIAPAGAVYSPAIPSYVAPPFLDATAQAFMPGVLELVSAPFIAPAGAVFTPGVGQFVAMLSIGPAGAVYSPTVLVASSVGMQFIAPGTVLFLPAAYAIVPSMGIARAIQYHVVVFSQDGSGGPGAAKYELTPRILNLAWQRTMNQAGQAAFSLARRDPLNDLLLPQQDHIKIFREAKGVVTCVFAGKLVKPDVTGDDVVWYAFDYLSYLQRSRTGYQTYYKLKKVGSEIVSPEWALAKGADHAALAFVATGTIQDPLGLDGVTPVTTNDQFGVNLFNRLFVFFSLAEMAMTNTPNTVVFEITDAVPHTFNFWKNRSADQNSKQLVSPGNLSHFDYDPGYDQLVLDLSSVIQNADGTVAEYNAADAALINTYRRLQGTVTVQTMMGLSSGTPTTDQEQAAVQRLLQVQSNLPRLFVARPRQGEIDPIVDYQLGDTLRTIISKDDLSGDALNQRLQVISHAVAWDADHAGELMTLYLRGKPGA